MNTIESIMDKLSYRVLREISKHITLMNTRVKVYSFIVQEKLNQTPKSLPELSDICCHRQPSTYGVEYPFFKIIGWKFIIIISENGTNVLLKISSDGSFEQFVGIISMNLETGEGKYSSEIVDEAFFEAISIEQIYLK